MHHTFNVRQTLMAWLADSQIWLESCKILIQKNNPFVLPNTDNVMNCDTALSPYFHFQLWNAQNVINTVELDANLVQIFVLNKITDFLGHRSWYSGQTLGMQISLFSKLHQTTFPERNWNISLSQDFSYACFKYCYFDTFSNNCTTQLCMAIISYGSWLCKSFWLGANLSFLNLSGAPNVSPC